MSKLIFSETSKFQQLNMKGDKPSGIGLLFYLVATWTPFPNNKVAQCFEILVWYTIFNKKNLNDI